MTTETCRNVHGGEAGCPDSQICLRRMKMGTRISKDVVVERWVSLLADTTTPLLFARGMLAAVGVVVRGNPLWGNLLV